MSTSVASLQPTYDGYISTTFDALVLFEACLLGRLNHVPRRPHDRERNQLIRSGCVFIYEENASGIKRWTDGVTWSPSRILGNFLIYRELDKPFPPGEKKRAMKKQHRRPPYSTNRNDHSGRTYSPTSASPHGPGSERPANDEERSLIGSLVDSYVFKEGGLVKKTMSVTVQGVTHHLVSYYKCDDVQHGKLRRPADDLRLTDVKPRNELQAKQNFRVSTTDENNPAEQSLEGHFKNQYLYSQEIVEGPYMNANSSRFFLPGNSFPTITHPASTGNSQYSISPSGGSQAYMPNAEAISAYGQEPFNRNFDGIGGNAVPASALTTSQPERSQSTAAVLYPQQTVHSRSMMNQSPLQVSNQTSNGYGLAAAGQAAHVETRQSFQSSPTQLTTPSRDHSMTTPMFTSDRRSSFYQNGGNSSMSTHHQPHHSYTPSAHMQSWPNSGIGPTSRHLQ